MKKWLKKPEGEETFYERVKTAAYNKQMSIKDVEEACEFAHNMIYRSINEPKMRAYNLIKICKLLDVSADYLLFGEKM